LTNKERNRLNAQGIADRSVAAGDALHFSAVHLWHLKFFCAMVAQHPPELQITPAIKKHTHNLAFICMVTSANVLRVSSQQG
jgi:hypothetical protein